MSATTLATTLQPAYEHPAALYPVVEDLTAQEYGCCPCDHENSILSNFPLMDGFSLSSPRSVATTDTDTPGRKRAPRCATSNSSLLKRRHSRESSFDDEITITTENEEVMSKFEDAYVLTRQIFACTRSKVWECVHRNTGIRRCVKIVHFDTLSHVEKEASQREITVLQKVQGHEGIIKLNEVFVNQNVYYVVMDLATGGNLLSRVIQQEMLSEETVRRISISVLNALKHLQTFDLCHNDLQPSNVVLDGTDNVVLVDCGSACPNGNSLDYDALHTSYTSPEIQSANTCTPVSDIWSLGAIIYFCFFGQAPASHSRRRTELTFPFNENVSRQAKQFMIACLHHDPTVRLTIDEALAHSWLEQQKTPKAKFAWKLWWRKFFCKKEPSNDIFVPSTSDSSGIGLSSYSFSWRT